MATPSPQDADNWRDLAVERVMTLLFAVLLRLPYALRVRIMGWLMARVLAPLSGYNKRVRENLALIWPELSPRELRRIERGVPDNFGRTLMEIFSGQEFKDRLHDTPLEGPGLRALKEARASGRPVILVSGHFGNHDAVRGAISDRFSPVGALYRPLSNVLFNRYWEQAVQSIAAPIFPRDRRGLAGMIKYLRDGNIIALLIDQHIASGARLTFFGKPARTSLSAAEMALKYDALLLPVFGLRKPDGLTFQTILQEPIAHGDAEEMTQQINDRIEAMVKAHPAQWFWVHRRWKAMAPGL